MSALEQHQTYRVSCLPCGGSGGVSDMHGALTDCDRCRGTGWDPVYVGVTCPRCGCKYTEKVPRECPRCQAHRLAEEEAK